MASALVCMVLHWTRLVMNNDERLLDYYDSPSYYVAWTLNLKKILSFVMKSTRNFDLKWLYISYRLGYRWWKLLATSILNRDTMIYHGIETMCLIGWSQRHVIMKFMVVIISLVEFNICSLKLEYVS